MAGKTTYSALKFDKGMTPKTLEKNAFTRIEHFDTTTEVLRPYRSLLATTNNTGSATSVLELKSFTLMNDTIYAVGQDASTSANGAIYSWDTTNFDWRNKWGFGVASATKAMLFNHKGVLFGLHTTSGRYLYSMTTGGVYTQVQDLGAPINGFCEAIIHSKDGCAYFATDNKIHKLSTAADGTAGTGYSLALTLPNSNFYIRSLSEQGNFINIVGYDVKSNQSWSLVWDRDSTVTDLTESISLGSDRVYHNAQLGTQIFFVQLRGDMSNSQWAEKPVLIIKYLNGNVAETLYEFPVTTLSTTRFGGKYQTGDKLYFAAGVKFVGESTVRNIIFSLDSRGKLSIAQNASVDSGTNPIVGILQYGEGFWLGAGSDGAWATQSVNSEAPENYYTVASYDTNDIRSDNLFANLDFESAVITCEPLPNTSTSVSSSNYVVGVPYQIAVVGTTDFTLIGASENTVGIRFIATGAGTGTGSATIAPTVTLKARKNEETSWTTIGIYRESNRAKFKVSAIKAKNALRGLDQARQVRFRLESFGGATITGFQAIFNDVTDKDV